HHKLVLLHSLPTRRSSDLAGLGVFGEIPPQVLHTISFVVALSIVVYLHMVVGEMAPKNIAISDPERSALAMAIPFRLYANLVRPDRKSTRLNSSHVKNSYA